METAKMEVTALLNKLPDDCTFEDIQYHLYVLEKIKKGIDSVQTHGSISQQEAVERLKKWIIKYLVS